MNQVSTNPLNSSQHGRSSGRCGEWTGILSVLTNIWRCFTRSRTSWTCSALKENAWNRNYSKTIFSQNNGCIIMAHKIWQNRPNSCNITVLSRIFLVCRCSQTGKVVQLWKIKLRAICVEFNIDSYKIEETQTNADLFLLISITRKQWLHAWKFHQQAKYIVRIFG